MQWYRENFVNFTLLSTYYKTLQWSTCPLAFGCWLSDHVIYISSWKRNNCLKSWANFFTSSEFWFSFLCLFAKIFSKILHCTLSFRNHLSKLDRLTPQDVYNIPSTLTCLIIVQQTWWIFSGKKHRPTPLLGHLTLFFIFKDKSQ